MRLARFERDGRVSIGALQGETVFDFSLCAPGLPATIEDIILQGGTALDRVRNAIAGSTSDLNLADVTLLAPITNPRKFLGIGFNYNSHVEEVRAKGIAIPDLTNQVWFNKQVSCISGPFDPIHLPAQSDQLDYEAELGIVIGKRCRHVSKHDARSVIFGYMVCNDISVRDWQLKAPTATLGKSFDTHGPIGPWITTTDEAGDPENLMIRTLVDGEVRQDANTSELVNRIDDMIAYLTAVFTLEPGDILSTGSPSGVGAARKPPSYLRAGQVLRTEIEGLGYLENMIVNEPLAQTTFIL